MRVKARRRSERRADAAALEVYGRAFGTLALHLRFGRVGDPVVSVHPMTTPEAREAVGRLQDLGVLGGPLPRTSRWSLLRYPVLRVLPEHEGSLLRAAVEDDGLALHQEIRGLSLPRTRSRATRSSAPRRGWPCWRL